MDLALKGKVRNYAGHDVAIVRGDGTKIQEYPKQGMVVVDTNNIFLGYLNSKVELSYERVVGLRGLPTVKQGEYLIVTKTVARAAALTGRTLEDLLVPDLPVRKYTGNASEIKGYQRLIPALYYCQSI